MKTFDPGCRKCPRLVRFLAEVRREFPDYHCGPVPPFGPAGSALLIVGLAPGKHGANASGRAFTGDYAGILLYETLHATGFASRPESVAADDGLQLNDCRIANAVKCLPPDNKPIGTEINNCNRFLGAELHEAPRESVVLALGGIAHRSVIRALGLRQADFRFGHAAEHALPEGRTLIDSYHCSRYNTQTKRLTAAMFLDVLQRCRNLVDTWAA